MIAGRVGRSKLSHVGTQHESEASTWNERVVAIFGPNFEGHGVKNRKAHPRPGESGPAKPNEPGSSDDGWGFHPDGTIDCVMNTDRWRLGADTDTWEVLWNMEATKVELMQGPEGHKSMLSRVVVNIPLEMDIAFVPDSKEWAVLIRTDMQSGQSIGKLVPKPATDPRGAALRARMARKRAFYLKNCPSKEKGESQGQTPSPVVDQRAPSRLDTLKQKIQAFSSTDMEEAVQKEDKIQPGEVKMPAFSNEAFVTSPKGWEYANPDPNLNTKISSDGSKLGVGPQLEMGSAMDRTTFKGNKALNRQLQQQPPNVVNYYPVVITLPNTLLGGLVRGALGAILVLSKARQENRRTDAG